MAPESAGSGRYEICDSQPRQQARQLDRLGHGMKKVFVKVHGKPEPKGSVNPMGSRVTHPEKTKAWETEVRTCVIEQAPGERIGGPVKVTLFFRLTRPPSVPIRKRRYPTYPPDLDKLSRTVLDAIQDKKGEPIPGLIEDDARVVALDAVKHYTDGDREPGVTIVVEGLDL